MTQNDQDFIWDDTPEALELLGDSYLQEDQEHCDFEEFEQYEIQPMGLQESELEIENDYFTAADTKKISYEIPTPHAYKLVWDVDTDDPVGVKPPTVGVLHAPHSNVSIGGRSVEMELAAVVMVELHKKQNPSGGLPSRCSTLIVIQKITGTNQGLSTKHPEDIPNPAIRAGVSQEAIKRLPPPGGGRSGGCPVPVAPAVRLPTIPPM